MKQARIIGLAPFIVFLGTFITLSVAFRHCSPGIADNFPIFSVLIALIFSFFTFAKKHSINEKLDIAIKGSAQPIILHMCYIFLFSTVFTQVLKQTGAIDSAVKICLFLIPAWSILPGIFCIASLFSLIVGTSMGAIASFMPIGISLAQHLNIDLSLVTATIISGAMFGDNLSILSDTTIAAVKIAKANMREKFLLNFKIAFIPFISTLAILIYKNFYIAHNANLSQNLTPQSIDIINILPYILAFYLAIIGIDILAVLIICIISAIGIGIYAQKLTFFDSINVVFNGFYNSKEMVNVFILVLLLAALSKIISYNGGIEYLLKKLQKNISSRKYGRFAQLILVSIVNTAIAINTISIIVTGPIATKIGDEYDIEPHETATVLDIGSCITQGILPYTPQLLLAASMAHISTISILPHLYYQYLLTVSLLVTLSLLKK